MILISFGISHKEDINMENSAVAGILRLFLRAKKKRSFLERGTIATLNFFFIREDLE